MMKKIFLEQFSHIVDTPQVVVFRSILEDNIQNMANVARDNSLKIRPHIKTHKTPQIARMQQELSSDVFGGITCSKVDEAIKFIDSGFEDVLLAYPIVSEFKAERFLYRQKLAQGKASVMIDSLHTYYLWDEVTRKIDYPISTVLKIDVGLHRCGFDPNEEKVHQITDLVTTMLENPNHKLVQFSGLMSHAGQAYGCSNSEEVKEIAKEEQRIMSSLKERIISECFKDEDYGLEISIGSTPTCLACEDYISDLVTEIRPGNYVFCDRTPLRLELIDEDNISMNVLAQVVSENEWFYIIDCGSKTLSSDRGAQGSDGSKGYGFVNSYDNNKNKNIEKIEPLYIEKLSEEHGWVKKDGINELEIGQKILVVPNHACAVSNLGDDLLIFNEKDNLKPIEIWDVKARGMRQ